MKQNRIKYTAKGISAGLSALLALSMAAPAFAEDTANTVVQEETTSQESQEDIQDSFSPITAAFALQLLSQTLEQGENRLIAPESVSEALTMAAGGAGGQTLTELQETIMGGMSVDTYRALLSAFHQRLAESEEVKFASADAIWLNDAMEIKLNEEFVKNNEEAFHAAIQSAPFDDETKDEINRWVSKHTDEMIPEMLSTLSPEALMYLINATVFEGAWENEFHGTEEGTFTDASGETQTVDMLSSWEDEYLELAGGVGFIKPYQGGEFVFVGILPEEGVTLEDYVAGLTGEAFIEAFRNRKDDMHVDIQLPKFSLDDGMSLVDALNAMGLQEAFGEDADFSAMLDEGSGLCIGDILHKTHIEVDEHGTKAAAATAIIERATSAMPEEKGTIEIHLDRPYLYAIVDASTGIPVFLGAQNTMK